MKSALIAKLISTIINPIALISLVPFLLIHKTTNNLHLAIYWTEISFIFILIFSLFVLLGVRLGYFSNLDISKRSQRPLLYSFAILMALVYLITLFVLQAPLVLYIAVIALCLFLAIGEVINSKIKLSLHVGTLVAFITTVIEVYGLIFIPLYILVPLVAWSRLKTMNHTPREVIVGGIVGLLLTVAVYLVFEYIIVV